MRESRLVQSSLLPGRLEVKCLCVFGDYEMFVFKALEMCSERLGNDERIIQKKGM